MDHNKLCKILQETGTPDHLTCILRNLYAGQEATVRTGHGTTDWFQIGKGVRQGCILSPCLFNFYAEYIMQNAGLGEAQDGIKISRKSINNFRYADDNTLMAEIEVELKRLLINLYAGQEATVRTGHGTTEWFQIGKGVHQGCILSPCLFNLYAEYIMQNAELLKHKLESRLLGEISITSDMQMTPPLWQKVKRN